MNTCPSDQLSASPGRGLFQDGVVRTSVVGTLKERHFVKQPLQRGEEVFEKQSDRDDGEKERERYSKETPLGRVFSARGMPKFVEDSLWQTLPFGRAIVCKLLEGGEQKGNMRWRWFTACYCIYCGICKMTIQCERGLHGGCRRGVCRSLRRRWSRCDATWPNLSTISGRWGRWLEFL